MLKIRLQRTGRKHQPTFRVVVTDSKNSAKSGRILEVVGAYDARRDDTTVLNADRIKYWKSVGASLSGTVNNLLISRKIIDGKKVNVLPKKTVAKKEEPAAESKPEATASNDTATEKTTEAKIESDTTQNTTPDTASDAVSGTTSKSEEEKPAEASA